MSAIRCLWSRLLREECGASSVEYAIMGSLIAAVIVGSVTLFGGKVDALFNTINNAW